MEYTTFPGKTYIVTSPNGGAVYDSDGRTLATFSANEQKAFVATTGSITVSDTAAVVTEVFKGAPALGGGGGSYTLTAEAVQEVVPLKWGNDYIRLGTNATSPLERSIAIGNRAASMHNSIVIGSLTKTDFFSCVLGYASSAGNASVTIGTESTTGNGQNIKYHAIAVGYRASALVDKGIVIGSSFTETVDGTNVTRTCETQGTGSITIGAGSNSLNATASDGTVTESSNSVTIGCKASNSAADSVCVGAGAQVSAGGGIAIGAGAVCADVGAVVFASYSSDRSYKTQLYFAGAGTPLAVQYYNGEAMIGYIVTDSEGNTVACGTNKLSALFPDNSATQAATVDDDGEWVTPTLFEPNDVKAEPSAQAYTPLPVYPIVEPEIDELTD